MCTLRCLLLFVVVLVVVQLVGFDPALRVHNYPVLVKSTQEQKQLKIVQQFRRMELREQMDPFFRPNDDLHRPQMLASYYEIVHAIESEQAAEAKKGGKEESGSDKKSLDGTEEEKEPNEEE